MRQADGTRVLSYRAGARISSSTPAEAEEDGLNIVIFGGRLRLICVNLRPMERLPRLIPARHRQPPVAAERLRRDLHARRRLPPLVLVAVHHLRYAGHRSVIVAHRDRKSV